MVAASSGARPSTCSRARARFARERKGDRQLQRGQGRGAGEGEREGGETLWTEGGRGAVCDSADDDGAGEGEALHGDRGGDPWPAALQEARNKQHARREAPHASLIRVVHEVHDPYPGTTPIRARPFILLELK